MTRRPARRPGRREAGPLRLGLDLGRTWLRASLAGPQGRVLRRCRLPCVSWDRLPGALAVLRRRLGFGPLARLTLGAAGLGTPTGRARARRLLRPWAARVDILSDVELAHAAAFAGEPGILVVAGTGSIALARDRRGRGRRAGGWGQLLGDEGSGFWIGRSALGDRGLRRRLRLDPLALAHAAQPVRAVAGLAPRILSLARRDRRARRIRDAAARHLAGLALEAGRALSWAGEVPVSWWGGVFEDRALRERFLSDLRRRRAAVRTRAPLMSAQDAAAVLEFGRSGRGGIPPS